RFAHGAANSLPFSAALARVSGTSRTPVVPALVAGAAAAAFLVVNVFIPGLLDLIVPVAILWANLAYLLVVGPLLYMRLRGWPGKSGSGAAGGFTLGRWALPVNLAAVVWSTLVIVNLGWPRAGPDPTPWYQQYGALLLTAALLAVGGAYYFGVQRHKARVLEEHRA